MPSPSATPCAANYEAVVERSPAFVRPASVSPDRHGNAVVEVYVKADGSIKYATLSRSSGNEQLDLAAVQVVRGSTFEPKILQCRAVDGVYRFVVDF
jgi:TonB family protein